MQNSYDVIKIDNYRYVILNTLQDFHFQEHSIFSINLDFKHAKPNIGKIFKNNTILITKYLNLDWNIVKSSIFTEK